MDVWARKQDMNTKRAIHALAGMNDRLYTIGGNHLKGKDWHVSATPFFALSHMNECGVEDGTSEY
jgi:hypothetical protein